MSASEPFDAVGYLNDPAWASSRYGLERMRELMRRLGNPQDRLRYVHVAGTNGKGSTCAYLEAVLRRAGYRTGLYTSPFIEVFEERIRVNGRNIPADRLQALTLQVRDAAEGMCDEARVAGVTNWHDEHPTAFELMTAVAFLYFAECACDIVVLEVGLGGRLDATNVIARPDVCVIARLGFDHTALLGNTLAAIAGEKAGIMKPGAPVVSWPQEAEAEAVLYNRAAELGCSLVCADFSRLKVCATSLVDVASGFGEIPLRQFLYKGERYQTQLLASYQPENAAVALEALEVLRSEGWAITPEAVREGIAACAWPGRFEIVGTRPLRIVDGSHNPQGIAALADTLREELAGVDLAFVLGILADKDYPLMLRELAGLGKAFYCVTPPSPRALPAETLASALRECTPESTLVTACASFSEATTRAGNWAEAQAPSAVVATGSLYSVAAAKAAFARFGGECVPSGLCAKGSDTLAR